MRIWFQSRTMREQLLVTGLVLMFAVTWLVSALGRIQGRITDWRSARQEHSAQNLWIERQAEIEERAAAAIRNLDPSKTYDPTRLNSALTTMASNAGLSPTIDPARTEKTAQFAYHTVRVTFRRANLSALLAFYDELVKQTPYLNLESVSLQSDRNAPTQLGAVLQISAPQIAQ
jgi:type II secretory pathway component PulM